MIGYIGITDKDWFLFNKKNKFREVVFWRRASKPVNLEDGSVFFLLVKGWRLIRGYGIVKKIGSDTIKDLWEEYGKEIGNESLGEAQLWIGKKEDDLIGYYILDEVKYFDKGIDLKDLDIEFANAIVSGKKIDYPNVKKILNSFKDEKLLKTIASKPQRTYPNTQKTTRTYVSERNLENILEERLEDIETGLKLIKRQFSIPIGRVDLFCKDKNNNLVIIELKKYGVSTYSIIDQIAGYMGYVKKHIAKKNQKVRGIIIVGNKDAKLEYATDIIPNLEVKTFKLSIK